MKLPGHTLAWSNLRRADSTPALFKRPSPPWVRLILSGSPTLTDLEWLQQQLRDWWSYRMPKGTVLWDVWHGDSRGVARVLGGFLERQGNTVVKMGAAWDVHDALGNPHKAWSERNEALLHRAYLEWISGGPEPYLVAFPGEDSQETWHAVGVAARMNLRWTPWEPGCKLVVIPHGSRDGLLEVCEHCLRACCVQGIGPCGLRDQGTSWLKASLLKDLKLEPKAFWKVAA